MEHLANMSDDERARFNDLIAADGELTIEELDTVAAGISVSSLACLACPVSCFSSVSN